MTINAIETRYKNYFFRSRLEARWAVFFDAMNIKYQYEPEGFVLGNGFRYLPDFYLPDYKLWVEVKGDLSNVTDDYLEKIVEGNDYGGGLPDMANSHGTTRGLLWLVGPIPYFEIGLPCHAILQHHKGMIISQCCFSPEILVCPSDTYITDGPGARQAIKDYSFSEDNFVPRNNQYIPDFAAGIMSAYAAARSARFEFGESGAA